MQPIVKIIGGLLPNDDNSIATAQTLAGAGALTLDGVFVSNGVATIDPPALVAVHSAGDDTGVTFTIVGTDILGNPISQQVTGANASYTSASLAYSTVTSVTASGATAGDVTVGNFQASESPPIALDPWIGYFCAAQVSLIQTNFNYSLQVSFDNPNDPVNPCAYKDMVWFPCNNSALTGKSDVSAFGDFQPAPLYVRLQYDGDGVAAGGYVRLTIVQYDSVPK